MRFGTLRTGEGLRAVMQLEDRLVDVNATEPELPNEVGSLLAVRPDALRRLGDLAARGNVVDMPYDPASLAPAVASPGKVFCIGKNYAEHVEELGGEAAGTRPEVFMRARTSLCGPFEDVLRPRVSEQVDYEVELAVVIGRPGRHIAEDSAMDHVGGYCVFNDVSIRDYQLAAQQWTPGKNFDRTGPLGPFVVTPDEVPDPHGLELSAAVDGEVLQRSTTGMLVRRIPELIAYLSSFATLEPGDVIATGTPGGVGLARTPPRWLRPGESLSSAISVLGEMRNRVAQEPG